MKRLRSGPAAAVLAALVLLAVSRPTVGVVLNGVVLGALVGLVALGIVLVFRATRVLNIAQAGLGAVPATAGLLLVGNGLPYAAGAALVLVLAVVLGLGVDLLLRRFRDAPRLIVTVATLGLAQVLAAAEVLLPKVLTGSGVPSSVHTPFGGASALVGGLVLTGDHLVALLVVGAVTAGLAVFLRRSLLGTALRASVDNRDRAATLGIPVDRLTAVVWVLAAVLSALAVLLRAPLVGLPSGGGSSTTLLLYALAAAVLGRLESLPLTFLGGIAIGVLDACAYYVSHTPEPSIALILPLVLGTLLRRRPGGRGGNESSFRAVKELPSIPAVLRSLPEVRTARALLPVAAAALLIALPFLLPATKLEQLQQLPIVTLACLSVVVLTGWTGQISLGQWAFAGIGAAVTGRLAADAGFDAVITIAIASLAGAVIAVLVGLPALRVDGTALAVVTLAVAATVSAYVLNPRQAPALQPKGLVQRPVFYGRFDSNDPRTFYYACLVVLAVALLATLGFRRSRTGRLLLATRDNPRAAAAYGVSVAGTRLAGFAFAGALAAAAGALTVYSSTAVDQGSFGVQQSITVFAVAVIGGVSSLTGALLGAGYYVAFTYLLPSDYQLLASGAGLLLLLLVAPGGLAELLVRGRDVALRVVARRRGLTIDVYGVTPTATVDTTAVPRLSEPDTVSRSDVPLLECRDVRVAYDGVQVLFGVDLVVEPGEVVALLGTNGAGKSTLLRAVAGLAPVSGGSVRLAGQDLAGASAPRRAKAGLSLVPGGKGCFSSLTVAEHLRLSGWGQDALVHARQLEETLDLLPRLRERLDTQAGDLSGGEQQMLALAIAFVTRPQLLLLDELSLGLAPTIVATLLAAVRAVAANGTTVVLVEQSVNVALTVASRATFLEKGRVVYSGPTADLLNRPDVLRAVLLAGVGTAPEVQEREDEGGEIRLQAAGLLKRYGGVTAVNDVDLTVRAGEVVGILGPNGSGKTSLLDLLAGTSPADGGTVLLGTQDVTTWPSRRRALAGLGRSFQDARLFPALTVAQNVAVALERHLPVRDALADAMSLPAVRVVEQDIRWTVGDLLELTGLTAIADRQAGELSTGTRRVLDLTLALAHDPSVLLLDEPGAGIAQREAEALGPLLRKVAAATGCALVLVEHDVPLLRGLCDRLIAMVEGLVVAEGTPDQVLAHPTVVAAYLGSDQAAVERSGTGARV